MSELTILYKFLILEINDNIPNSEKDYYTLLLLELIALGLNRKIILNEQSRKCISKNIKILMWLRENNNKNLFEEKKYKEKAVIILTALTNSLPENEKIKLKLDINRYKINEWTPLIDKWMALPEVIRLHLYNNYIEKKYISGLKNDDEL